MLILGVLRFYTFFIAKFSVAKIALVPVCTLFCISGVCVCTCVCVCLCVLIMTWLHGVAVRPGGWVCGGVGVGVWCRRAVYRLPPICGGRSASAESQPQLLLLLVPGQGRKLHTGNREGKGTAVRVGERDWGGGVLFLVWEDKLEAWVAGG